MYVPNRETIFNDIEYTQACEDISCHNIHTLGDGSDPVCSATHHGDCPRTNILADEVKEFIWENDDMFKYIRPVDEQ